MQSAGSLSKRQHPLFVMLAIFHIPSMSFQHFWSTTVDKSALFYRQLRYQYNCNVIALEIIYDCPKIDVKQTPVFYYYVADAKPSLTLFTKFK